MLSLLLLNPDMSIAILAEKIGINKSAMQKLMDSMEDKGYISRNEKDGTWHVLAIYTK